MLQRFKAVSNYYMQPEHVNSVSVISASEPSSPSLRLSPRLRASAVKTQPRTADTTQERRPN
jgi:hypothetical protein